EDDGLAGAGRARGEDEEERVVVADRAVRMRRPADPARHRGFDADLAELAGGYAVVQSVVVQPVQCAPGERRIRGFGDEESRTHEAQLLGDLTGGEPPGDRSEHEPGLGAGEEED